MQFHFEECQFELHRADGKKLLKWNAVPTLFSVPNPPKPLTLKRPANRLVVEKSKAAAVLTHVQSTTDHDHPCKKRIKKENIPPPSSTPASEDHTYGKGTCKPKIIAKKPTLMPYVGLTDIPSAAATAMIDSQHLSQTSTRSGVTVGRTRKQDVINRLREQVRCLRQKLNAEKRRSAALTVNLRNFLNEDQLECLQLSSRRAARWSNATVKKALQIRCATGASGYSYLVKEGYPLPSYRTLCEKVENARFQPGLQEDVMEWLRVKVGDEPQMSRDCVLALDEMQLRPTIEYDRGE